MAKKRGRPAKTRRPRQPKLPAMEDVSYPDIDEAAGEYVDARDNRMAMLKDEVEKGTQLLQKMREHNLNSYSYDGQIVTVVNQTKVKVQRPKEEADA